MSPIENAGILHHEIYEHDSEMGTWLAHIFHLPSGYINPPRFFTYLSLGGVAGDEFKHFTVEVVAAGHLKEGGSWWDLYSDNQVPGFLVLSMRVFYNDELPTKENTKLELFDKPERPYIEQATWYIPPETLLHIEGIQTVSPDMRLDVINKLLPGLKLFHPDTKVAILKSTRGGDWRDQSIQAMWANTEVLKDYAKIVNQLKPTWIFIKANIFWKGEADADRGKDWVSKMWEDETIRSFAAKHHKFTKELLARAVDYDEKEVNREPLALACFHAALEFETNISGESLSIVDLYLRCLQRDPSPSTLVAYYKKGAFLLTLSE